VKENETDVQRKITQPTTNQYSWSAIYLCTQTNKKTQLNTVQLGAHADQITATNLSIMQKITSSVDQPECPSLFCRGVFAEYRSETDSVSKTTTARDINLRFEPKTDFTTESIVQSLSSG